ncbi:MAG: hypothetical protein ACYS7M_04390 [Planctomycetota bacterium]|jgi:hypothetical protein
MPITAGSEFMALKRITRVDDSEIALIEQVLLHRRSEDANGNTSRKLGFQIGRGTGLVNKILRRIQ